MVETIVLKAEKRSSTGTSSSRKLRKTGRIPAVVYGHSEAVLSISLDAHDVALELQHHHRLMDVEIEGKVEKLLLKDAQYDHLYMNIVHVDLVRVDLNERVKVTVPVELRGTAAGISEGGVLDQIVADVDLECVVTAIPESIRANVAGLKIGESLLAKDLILPDGVTLVTDANAVIAAVHVIAEEAAPVAAAGEAAATAEPEVIGKPAEEESEQAES